MNIVIALGSNLGNKLENLLNAQNELASFFNSPSEISSIFLSEPYGDVIQEDFLNMVLVYTTSTTDPHSILEKCQSIEDQLGRVRDKVWGPRIIDIDILFIDDKIINTHNLIIPHPHINERSFVLLPLQELAIYNDLKQFYQFEDLTTTKSIKI